MIRATMALGVLCRVVDKLVVDGILHAVAWVCWGISQVVRLVGDELLINGGFDAGCEGVRGSGKILAKLQSGRVQNYLRVMAVGVVALLVVYFVK